MPCGASLEVVQASVRHEDDIEITDQTADVDPGGRSAPVKVTVRASAIVSVGEFESSVKFSMRMRASSAHLPLLC